MKSVNNKLINYLETTKYMNIDVFDIVTNNVQSPIWWSVEVLIKDVLVKRIKEK